MDTDGFENANLVDDAHADVRAQTHASDDLPDETRFGATVVLAEVIAELGADVVFGSAQRFGVPMGYWSSLPSRL